MIPAGQKAQSQEARTATERPPTRRAAKKSGTVAAAEKMELRSAAARKEENVNGPKMRKMAPSRAG